MVIQCNNSTEVIDLSNLSGGVYFAAVETKEGIIIKKIIKNK
ncbi:MAG: T9SS type A sorting domain-containing protein [Bacteroidia bacterium]